MVKAIQPARTIIPSLMCYELIYQSPQDINASDIPYDIPLKIFIPLADWISLEKKITLWYPLFISRIYLYIGRCSFFSSTYFYQGKGHLIYIYSFFIHFTFVYMLNAICITTNQLEHIQTHLCIHLSYLEYQRNLKIYNKNIKK